MKNFLISACWWGACIFLAVCLTSIVAQPALEGSGIVDSEMRHVPDFTAVQVSGGVELDLIVGPATAVEVVADDNILPHVRTDVSGGRIRIEVDEAFTSSLGVKVRAMTPQVKAVDASGASKVKLTGVRGQQFRVGLSGASTCALTGNVERCEIRLSGASTCKGTLNGENVRIRLSGASKLTLDGQTDQLLIECSGASRVSAGEFRARSAKCTASGASSIEVSAKEDLTARASGASSIRYTAKPANLHERASGGSTIGPKLFRDTLHIS